MDDGTAGEMVASCNYWKAMSKNTTNKKGLDGSIEPPSNPEMSCDNTSGEKENGGDNNGGDGGESCGGARFGTSSILGGVEWASNHLESGNVKVDTSVSAAEASFDFSEGNTLNLFLMMYGLRLCQNLNDQFGGLGTRQRGFAPRAIHHKMFGV